VLWIGIGLWPVVRRHPDPVLAVLFATLLAYRPSKRMTGRLKYATITWTSIFTFNHTESAFFILVIFRIGFPVTTDEIFVVSLTTTRLTFDSTLKTGHVRLHLQSSNSSLTLDFPSTVPNTRSKKSSLSKQINQLSSHFIRRYITCAVETSLLNNLRLNHLNK